MPTLVDIPEVGEVEFPDDMTTEQISETIRTKILAPPALPEDIPLTDSGPARAPIAGSEPVEPRTPARFGVDLVGDRTVDAYSPEFEARAQERDTQAVMARAQQEELARENLTQSRAELNRIGAPYGMSFGDGGMQRDPSRRFPMPPTEVQQQMEQLIAKERPARDYLDSLSPKPEQPTGGTTTAVLGNLGGGVLGAASGAMELVETPGTTAADPENQERLDEVNRRLNVLRSEITKDPKQAPALTPEITRYSDESEILSKQPSKAVGGLASDMRREAAGVPGAGGSIGRAVGSVGAFVPAMTMGPAGLAGIGLAAAQAAADAKSSTQAAVEQELKSSGMTDDYQIALLAREAGNKAAIKTAITMPIYIGTGKLAAAATAKTLPSLTGGAAFAAQTGTATAANVATGAAMRALEGEEAMPNLEQFASDVLWGLIQGGGESSKASAKAVEKARTELRSRGWSEERINAPYVPPEGLVQTFPRTGAQDGMQFPVPRGSEPALGETPFKPSASMDAPAMQREVDAAQAKPSAPVPKSPSAGIVPAIKVGEQIVRGKPGESHIEILERHIAENPKDEGAWDNFETPKNPNFFIDEAGNQLTRDQLQERTGKRDSQGLKELQDAEAERRLGSGAANIEEPFAKLPSTSNKEVVVNAERKAENLDPIIKEARVGNVETVDRAETILEENPRRGAEIVERLRSQNPQERTIALEDGAILLVDRVRLKNERALNEQRALDENTTAEERQVAQNEVARLSNEIYAMDAAAQGARSTWGRFGQLWQRTMRDDYTFDAMERRASLAKGKPLTEPERQRVKKQSEEIQKAEDAFEKRRTLLEEELPVDEAIKAIEVEARKNPEFTPEVRSLADRITARLDSAAASALKRLRAKFAQVSSGVDPTILVDVAVYGASKIAKGLVKFTQWSASMVKDFGDGVKPYLEDAWAQANKSIDDAITAVRPKDPAKVKDAVTKVKAVATADSIGEKMKARAAEGEKIPQMRGDIQKLVETLVRGGIKERGALVDAVHEVLKGVDPSVTRRQASDAISGYGDFKPLSKDAVKVEVRDLKGQLQQVSKLEDIQARVPLKKTGVERPVPSTEQRNLIQQVNDAKKKFGVVVTDTALHLKSATDAVETRLSNQIKDITRQIENGEDPRTRTPAPTNERIEQLRALRDRVQSTLTELRGKPQATPEQRATIVRKNLESQVAELERRIKTGDTSSRSKPPEVRGAEIDALRAQRDALKAELNELKVADEALVEERKFDSTMKSVEALEAKLASGDTSSGGKRKLGPDSEMVSKAKENLAALRKEMQDLRKAENPPKPEEQRKLESAMKAVEKSIAEYDRRLRVGDMSAKMKKGATSPELETLRAERDAMRSLFTELRDGPPRTKEEIAIAALKSRLTRQIADKTDRMARGDFSPTPKRPPLDISKDPEAVRLSAESQRVKREYEQDRIKAEFSNQSIGEKAWRMGKETLNLPRAVLSSWDLSAVLRQGGFITLGNPVRAARAMGEMFKAVASQKQAELAEARIRNRPNAPLYDEAGLYLAPLEDVRISRQEEQIMSELANKIPGVKVSNRAFVTFLNRLRADSFDTMVASLQKKGAPLSAQEMKAIANYINVATGRGDLGKASQAATTLATVFFSPRLTASRFQLLLRPALGFRQGTETSLRVRKAVAKEYGKMLLGLSVVYGLATLAGATIEDDPRQGDFGKLRFGNTTVDPLAGLAQTSTLLARMTPIYGKKFDSGPTMWNFMRNKFTPILGAAFDAREILSGRKTPKGHSNTLFKTKKDFPYVEGVIPGLLFPLSFRDVVEVMEEQGVSKGLMIQMLNMFGWGLQNYNKN